jgi:RHS repeat-associated protein
MDLPTGQAGLPDGKRGAYDYFIRDYQQNVRMILTEETHYGINQCTMEAGREVNEEPYFGQEGANNEVAQTRSDKPPGWTSNSSNKVSQLGALTHKAGPNVLLKVMAGDEITATTNYYYQNPVVNSTGNNLTGPIITSLVQSILGGPATSLIKGNTTPISTNLNADALFNSATAPDANNATGNLPKAYLTIVFFNERFEYVSEGSTALRVMQAGDGADPLVLSNIKAPKNGFAYVYLSNESNEPVYFDDFKVADTRGRIIEEDHYYAFGLKIAGISSVKFGDEHEGMLANKNLYNDKELFDDADLNWYDYGFRNYDPQIGRFPQLDPLTWDYPELTNYQYASNDPILNIDLDGLEGFNAIQTLSEVVVVGRSTAPTALSVTGNFFKGIGGSLWGTVTGVVGAVAHPINTISGIAHAAAHPIQTANALIGAGKQLVSDFRNGNADTRANLVGHAVGDIAQIFLGTSELKAASKAITVAKDVGKVEELGIVYERINLKTGERYIGQAKSKSRFLERQIEHDRKLGVKHKYNELGRAKPGQDLNVLEETHIRMGGGPIRKGGNLANKRYQMNDLKYKAAGGTVIKPTL